MKHKGLKLSGKNVNLRLIEAADKDAYYSVGFESGDEEIAYYTGTVGSISKEATDQYIERIVDDESRYDFLILDKADKIVGEAILKDIDEDVRSASFRIALFQAVQLNRGLGTEATALTVRFAFEFLKLHRVELEVYDFNHRAKRVYEKVGFVQEGVKRDGAFLNGKYCDVILMSILETDVPYDLGI